jgi:hypothetical protein
MQCGNISYSNQCRRNAWARWAVARGPMLIYEHHVFLCLNTDFVRNIHIIYT